MSFKRGTSIKKTADKTTRKVNKTSIVQYLILRLKVITFQSYKFILFLEIQQKKYYWKSKWYCYQSVYHSHCRSKVQSFTVTNTVSISSAVHFSYSRFQFLPSPRREWDLPPTKFSLHGNNLTNQYTKPIKTFRIYQSLISTNKIAHLSTS